MRLEATIGKGRSIFTSVCPGVSWTFLALCQRAGLKNKAKKSKENTPPVRNRHRQLYLDLLVLQLHNGLHSAVVVVKVDSAHHFGAFEVTDLHRDFTDGVAANEFDNLLCGGVAGVYFNGWQLDILQKKKTQMLPFQRSIPYWSGLLYSNMHLHSALNLSALYFSSTVCIINQCCGTHTEKGTSGLLQTKQGSLSK